MKSTLTNRTTANPRRTTLAHLKDASELTAAARTGADELAAANRAAERARPLPTRTANPRRTVLTELPTAPAAS